MKIYINKSNGTKQKHPCITCQTGWGSYSMSKDEKGEFVESSSCYDSCEKLKKYVKNKFIN